MHIVIFLVFNQSSNNFCETPCIKQIRSKSTFYEGYFMERIISYDIRHGDDAKLPKARTTSFGIETIAYLGNKQVNNVNYKHFHANRNKP